MDVVCKIEALFERRGAVAYQKPAVGRGASRGVGEGVSALAHALQCAQLAEWADADRSLVAAALLHDLGGLLDAAADAGVNEELHETRALGLLAAGGFGSAVLEPIRLHVQAERLLANRMNPVERLVFLAQTQAASALQLARWDALACHPGKRTPPLAYYLNLLDDVLRDARQPPRLMVA